MHQSAVSEHEGEMGIVSFILAVDDDPAVLRLIKRELSDNGFSVLTADSGEEALELLERYRPDAVIIDILMPGMTGLELMQKIRARSQIPIILLTGCGRNEDVVRGLEMGADDYLSKPFNPTELGARIHAVIRRDNRVTEGEEVVRFGDIEIDLASRVLRKDGQLVRLTRTEWLLLRLLASRPGTVISNEELLTKVWGPGYVNDLQYLRVWVSRIRGKIEDGNPKRSHIKTLHGRGYMFDPIPAAA
jgi:DNA-binding response OmpR family regulator